jgi:outer membrane immunogenic protein
MRGGSTASGPFHGWLAFQFSSDPCVQAAVHRGGRPYRVIQRAYMIGGTLGYNFQTGSFVWGLEGDIDYADVKGSATCLAILSCETKNTWLATARVRFGYAFDRFMPYVTGGAAFGEVEANVPTLSLSTSDTRTGWTIGGGLEYAFLGNWTAKIEYLYVDLGSFDTGFTAPLVTNNVDLRMNVIRAGLNYKFSGPVFSRW